MRVDDIGLHGVEMVEDSPQVGGRCSDGGVEVESDVELGQRDAREAKHAVAVAALIRRRVVVFGGDDHHLVALAGEALCQLRGEM